MWNFCLSFTNIPTPYHLCRTHWLMTHQFHSSSKFSHISQKFLKLKWFFRCFFFVNDQNPFKYIFNLNGNLSKFHANIIVTNVLHDCHWMRLAYWLHCQLIYWVSDYCANDCSVTFRSHLLSLLIALLFFEAIIESCIFAIQN